MTTKIHETRTSKSNYLKKIYSDHLVKINKQVNLYDVKYDQFHNIQDITTQFNIACEWLQFYLLDLRIERDRDPKSKCYKSKTKTA